MKASGNDRVWLVLLTSSGHWVNYINTRARKKIDPMRTMRYNISLYGVRFTTCDRLAPAETGSTGWRRRVTGWPGGRVAGFL